MSTLKTTYKDIEITFNEHTEKWEFILRGRSMARGKLSEAKKAIDAPPPKDKKPFERIEVYRDCQWRKELYEKVTVTSIAESSYGGTMFWIVDSKNQRAKENGSRLFLINEHNDKIIADIKAIIKDQEWLRKQHDQLRGKLQTIHNALKDVEV